MDYVIVVGQISCTIFCYISDGCCFNMGHFKAIPRTVGPHQDRSFTTQRPQDRSSKHSRTLDRLLTSICIFQCTLVLHTLRPTKGSARRLFFVWCIQCHVTDDMTLGALKKVLNSSQVTTITFLGRCHPINTGFQKIYANMILQEKGDFGTKANNTWSLPNPRYVPGNADGPATVLHDIKKAESLSPQIMIRTLP